jgi:hypothetical protein
MTGIYPGDSTYATKRRMPNIRVATPHTICTIPSIYIYSLSDSEVVAGIRTTDGDFQVPSITEVITLLTIGF